MKKLRLLLLMLIIVLVVSSCSRTMDKQTNQNTNQVNTNKAADSLPPAANETEQKTAGQPKDTVSGKDTKLEKGTSFYFIRNKMHEIPSINSDAITLLKSSDAFYTLPNNERKIYLTFDCGYELGYTPQILGILEKQQIKAAFFISGDYIKSRPDLVKKMQTDGHLVCNHTWNHPDLSTLNKENFNKQINSLDNAYLVLTGVPMSKYLRPPMGNYSSSSLAWAKELGYKTVFWSIAFNDWDPNKQPGAEYSYNHVIDNIHPGAVILLHAVSKSDTEALERIIIELKSQGYVFSTF